MIWAGHKERVSKEKFEETCKKVIVIYLSHYSTVLDYLNHGRPPREEVRKLQDSKYVPETENISKKN